MDGVEYVKVPDDGEASLAKDTSPDAEDYIVRGEKKRVYVCCMLHTCCP